MFKFVLILLISFSAYANKGLEIAKKIESFNEGYKGEESEMEMTLINAHGDKIVRKMESKVKEEKDDGDKSIITFKWPADVKGTKMLTWTHKTESDDQWLYLPAFRRVKRISSRNKSGSFMGSEFSYEDLGSQEVEKYTYKFISEKPGKEWTIERYPTDKKSGYSKQLVVLDAEKMITKTVKYFDRKGELLKTATFSEPKKFGKYWRSMKIFMENHQTQKKSELIWKNRSLNKSFSSREFTKAKLK